MEIKKSNQQTYIGRVPKAIAFTSQEQKNPFLPLSPIKCAVEVDL